ISTHSPIGYTPSGLGVPAANTRTRQPAGSSQSGTHARTCFAPRWAPKPGLGRRTFGPTSARWSFQTPSPAKVRIDLPRDPSRLESTEPQSRLAPVASGFRRPKVAIIPRIWRHERGGDLGKIVRRGQDDGLGHKATTHL